MAGLAALCRDCLYGIGVGARPMSVLQVEEPAVWMQPVTFSAGTIDMDLASLGEIVLEKVTAAVRQMMRDLLRRSADPKFGFTALPQCRDLKGEPGWVKGMDRYMVVLRWEGPKPKWWPYAVTDETAKMPKSEDVRSDSQFKKDYGEAPDKMLMRLREEKARSRRRPNAPAK